MGKMVSTEKEGSAKASPSFSVVLLLLVNAAPGWSSLVPLVPIGTDVEFGWLE